MPRFALLAAALLAGCPSAEEAPPEPTAEPTPADPCLDVPAGDSADCPAVSCRALAEDRPDAEDGDYWLDGGLGVAAALATCDLSGGGWLEVVFEDGDGVLVAENGEGNPWHKCDDDAAAPYAHVASEDVVVPDWSSGNVVWTVDLRWTRPAGGEPYGPLELNALRAPLTELDPTTRMVATTGDDDFGRWQDGTGGGHEVYVVRGDGDWTLLSPGTNGECGGASGWPAEGSRTATYLWATEPIDSEVRGDTGTWRRASGLEPSDLLPVQAVLVVATGGGVSFGFEERVARMR